MYVDVLVKDSDPLPLDASTMTSPTDTETVGDNIPLLTWDAVTDATRFKIGVSTSPSFATVLLQTISNTHSKVLPVLSYRKYYWLVAAGIFAKGEWSYLDYSETCSLTVDSAP